MNGRSTGYQVEVVSLDSGILHKTDDITDPQNISYLFQPPLCNETFRLDFKSKTSKGTSHNSSSVVIKQFDIQKGLFEICIICLCVCVIRLIL